jgi:histidine triad (HIT) family protein
MSDNCPFCNIILNDAPATIVKNWDDAIAIVPLGPVVKEHILVIPRRHVEDFTTDPEISAITIRHAAELAKEMDTPMNLITSKGKEATQSVFHLHIHLVPRKKNDGLALPWYSGKGK